MDTQVAAWNERTSVALTTHFQKLLNSGVKLSGAASMYSLQQFENAMGNIQDRKKLSKQIDRVQAALDEVSGCLVSDISQSKKDAVESFTSVGEQLFRTSVEGLSLFDPREMLRAANSLAQKSTETISHWVARKSPVAAEEPRLAADVLAG